MNNGMRAAIAPDMHEDWLESATTLRVLRPGTKLSAVSLLPPLRPRARVRRFDPLSVLVGLGCLTLAAVAGLIVTTLRAAL